MPPDSRGQLALAGAVAGGAGIAVAHALTNLLNARATPIQGVAEVVIEVTPGPVAEAFIQLVGRNDKPILVGGVTLAVIGLGALAGVLTARSRLAANLVFLAMAAIALLALMSRPGFTTAAVIPLAGGVATWLVVLAFLVDAVPTRAATGEAEDASPGAGPSRRFVVVAASVAVAAVAVGASGRLFGRSLRAVETTRRLLRLPVTRGAVPAGAELGVPGTTPWRVPSDEFYRIDTALVLPAIDPNEWRLRIHGMVDRELTLTYEDLLAREMTEAWVTLCCVSNPVGGDLIGNAWWSGVRIADLLAEAGVQPGADAVKQTSEDGWTCGTPIEALTDDRDSLLAVAMNGQPLPVEHGFPVRMVVPGLYGFVSATKWVVDLEVTRLPGLHGLLDRARLVGPRSGQDAVAHRGPARRRRGPRGQGPRRRPGLGAAHRHRRGGGAARRPGAGSARSSAGCPATTPGCSGRSSLDAPAGEHTLAVRATDRSGYTQTAARADVVPDGATGWHTVDFTTT